MRSFESAIIWLTLNQSSSFWGSVIKYKHFGVKDTLNY